MEEEKKDWELDVISGTDTLTRPETETKTPSFFKVILLNDDFTPMDFVVHILEKFFHKNEQEATQVMLNVHRKGKGVAGVFPFEVAETKTYQVNQYARGNKYPLKCVMEKA